MEEDTGAKDADLTDVDNTDVNKKVSKAGSQLYTIDGQMKMIKTLVAFQLTGKSSCRFTTY